MKENGRGVINLRDFYKLSSQIRVGWGRRRVRVGVRVRVLT